MGRGVKMFQVKSISLNKNRFHCNYQNMSWYDLAHGIRGGRVIQSNKLELECSIAPALPDHTELFYYPELAKKLLSMEYYPSFCQSFPEPNLPRGKQFIFAFCDFYESSLVEFEKKLANLTNQFQLLIESFGQKRFTPKIDAFEPYQLVINGMKWHISHDAFYNHKNAFSLKDLLKFDEKSYKIENAIIGTPCLALRLSNDYRNKGHVIWYNLDTCQKITPTEARKWQPIKQNK